MRGVVVVDPAADTQDMLGRGFIAVTPCMCICMHAACSYPTDWHACAAPPAGRPAGTVRRRRPGPRWVGASWVAALGGNLSRVASSNPMSETGCQPPRPQPSCWAALARTYGREKNVPSAQSMCSRSDSLPRRRIASVPVRRSRSVARVLTPEKKSQQCAPVDSQVSKCCRPAGGRGRLLHLDVPTVLE